MALEQFTVKVEGEIFNCQSSALLHHSDFFKTLINGPFKENGTSCVQLDNSGMVSVSSFRLLMDMMTFGTTRIHEESVNTLIGLVTSPFQTKMNMSEQDISKLGINTKLDALYVIYGVSKYFGMNEWLYACEQWWLSHVHMRMPNAMEIWKLSQQFEMPMRIQQQHIQFILKNFERIATYTADTEQHHVNISESFIVNEDFFQVDLDSALQILTRDDLAVPNEKFVIDSAFQWCRWNSSKDGTLNNEQFKKLLKQFLPIFRFGTLKPELLEEVLQQHPLIEELAEELHIDMYLPSTNFRIRQKQTRDMMAILKKNGQWKGFSPVYIDIHEE